ncbi:MAG: cytochrome c biogenesis protein CcsA [Bacteroidia bacterium]|nr:cytochrome c biogenesis protein CcsA [Bacteroidia bacterium]
MEYAGEHLWAGNLGNAFVVLSLVAALVSCFTYLLASKNSAYLALARAAFNVHSFSVIGIAGTLFFMLFNHYFEYQYVYQHSNTTMNMKYILSCFWEGQEGSFLLWTFWNMVLGLILKKQLKGGDWEVPVMMVFALVQVFLASMILGIYLIDYKIGTNPFMLLRDHPDYAKAPFIQGADYVSKLNGRGLNPLLMNYWMTIHPPTLFLGFASTLIPFAFAIGAFWNKKYNEWQTIALPWTYFGILILGVGILMGGAWAYEALSFGGFWAWDPVENSSLVPWLVLVAAGHTMIINKNKGGSLFTTHFLAICSFLLVLYSTFLTRSGILGNASVHAFTDLGMTGQLVLYVLTFIFISVALLVRSPLLRSTYMVLSFELAVFASLYDFAKLALMGWVVVSAILIVYAYVFYFPKEKEEEDLFSREFWIFLGSLVLVLSALIITFFTSTPVINKLFGTELAPQKVPEYNRWMAPFAIAMILLVAAAQFLKYKKTEPKKFLKRIALNFFVSLVFGLICCIPLYFMHGYAEAEAGQKWDLISYALLFIASVFAAVANFDYFLAVLKGKVMKSGASIAHIGFALILLGALISTSKKTVLSQNTSERKVSGLGADFDDKKSILLTQGDTLPMGPYFVTYTGKKREGINVSFNVDYLKRNEQKELELDFTLSPLIQDNPRMGRAAEPATRHYLSRDIYTHVTYADLEERDTSSKARNAYSSAKNYIGGMGDTIYSSNAIIVIDSLRSNLSQKEYEKNSSSIEVTAVLRCMDVNSNVYKVYPKFVIKNSIIIPQEAVCEPLGLKFVFWKINPEEGHVEITMSEKVVNSKDFIVMEAYVFPYINILWLGSLIMAIGTAIAIVERIRKFRPTKVNV